MLSRMFWPMETMAASKLRTPSDCSAPSSVASIWMAWVT
jgi:hypothetical protein